MIVVYNKFPSEKDWRNLIGITQEDVVGLVVYVVIKVILEISSSGSSGKLGCNIFL